MKNIWMKIEKIEEIQGKCWWVIVCQIHRRIPQSRVASLFSSSSNICPSNDRQVMGRSASAFQLFIVGSKQFFRSFDPFLLYLTFSILKQKLSARVGTAIESEKTKCLDVFTLGIAQSDCLFFHSSTYLKKKPSICWTPEILWRRMETQDNGFLKEIDGVRKEKERLTAAKLFWSHACSTG